MTFAVKPEHAMIGGGAPLSARAACGTASAKGGGDDCESILHDSELITFESPDVIAKLKALRGPGER